MNDLFSECEKKKCRRCGIEYPIEFFYMIYHKDRGKKYRNGHCSYCDKAQSKAYRDKHRKRILARKKEKYESDPWTIRLTALLRRCKLGFITVEELKQLVEDAKSTCTYCGQHVNGTLTFDHATPVSKGGTNDIENLRVACLSCNSKKQDKTEAEFMRQLTGVPF